MTEDYRQLKAPIFNIQSYSIHDGPGIRVTVFEKGCPLRCLWCANPESNTAAPQLMTYSSKCTGCGRCVDVCPKKAIHVGQIEEGGKYIAITDRDLCVDCGACVKVCPADAREIAGELKTVQEVIDQVLKDKLFLDTSGGGMTISGGEMLAHPDFSAALLRAAKEEGLHTAVESCSFAPRDVIDKVYRYVDLALLDIKQMDSAKHLEYTGVDNVRILDNIRHIHNDLGVKTIIRVPVITGYNDDKVNIAETAKWVRDNLGSDVEIDLLPYHRLGESKNEALGNYEKLGIDVPSDEYMQELKALAEKYVEKAKIGG